MGELFARLRTEEHALAVREYLSRLFGPDDDPQRCEWILAESTRVPRHVVLSAWENGFFGFDSAEVVAACRTPFMYVDAGPPNVDLEELRRLCPTLVLGRTVGAGHFHQLEVPDQVNAMIERFLVLDQRPTKLVQEIGVTSVGRRAMSPLSRCRPGPRADGTGTQPPQVRVLATARDNLDP